MLRSTANASCLSGRGGKKNALGRGAGGGGGGRGVMGIRDCSISFCLGCARGYDGYYYLRVLLMPSSPSTPGGPPPIYHTYQFR